MIKIDHREHELIKHVTYLKTNFSQYNELQISVENLPLGDIILSNGSKEEVIIERKTINDLLSSIKDGRY
jgi:ERCC4-type nuclease